MYLDATDKARAGAEQWFLHRAGELGPERRPIDLNGNPFRGSDFVGIARRMLELRNVRTAGLSRSDILIRALTHSTSDFAVLLQNLQHKILAAAYASTADTWRRFCAVGELRDFRPHYRYRMGSFNDLKLVTENNEFEEGTLSDAERETIQGATKGRIFNISRQVLLNDDMGAFASIPRALGRSAARTVEKDVFALLAQNAGAGPTLSDGNPLFHSSHANVALTPAAPTVQSFDAARAQMATQTDPGGIEIIDVRPAIWLGPVGLEGQARVVNEAQYDPDTPNKLQRPNQSRGILRDIVGTGRLAGTGWYVFADPVEEPTLEVSFIDRVQEPSIDMEEGFRSDGVSWRVRLDYAVAAVGHRGAVRNAGASPE